MKSIRQALSNLASTLRGSVATTQCDDVRINIQDGVVSGMTSTSTPSPSSAQLCGPARGTRVLRSPNVPPIVISVDGNIGAGKSTIISQLKTVFEDMPNVHFIHEPVDTIWNRVVDESGETLLSNFYKNPTEHAFTFQIMAYISRLSILAQAVKNLNYDIIITERCLETDRNVFEKMLHDQGIISKMEHAVYNMWFDEFYRDVRCNAFIYVQASVDTCMQRIKHRSRDGETISRDYIARCVEYHENWIMNDTRKRLVIDADSDSVSNEEVRDQKILQIVTFIHSLCTDSGADDS
jgi:deoxycitidine kinase/deoxyguanosine kinase